MRARKLRSMGRFLALVVTLGAGVTAGAQDVVLLAEFRFIQDNCAPEFGSPEITGCSAWRGEWTSTELAVDIRDRDAPGEPRWMIEGITPADVGRTFVLSREDPRFDAFAHPWTDGSGLPYATEYDFRFAAGGVGIDEEQLRFLNDSSLVTTYFAEPLANPYDLDGYYIDYFTITLENVASAVYEENGSTYTEWAGRFLLQVWGTGGGMGNHAPVVTLDPHGGFEGSPIRLSGIASDVDPGDTLTYAWTCTPTGDVDPYATCVIDDSTTVAPSVSCTDDGNFTLSFTASDGKASSTALNTLMVYNLWPTVSFGAPADGALFPVNTYVSVDVLFEDRGRNDSHDCLIDWGDLSTRYEAACSQDVDLIGVSHLYEAAGVYTIAAYVKDDDGGDRYAWKNVVVYDPSGGYVSGEGWILSPPGAYPDNPVKTGKANFAFVSKYRKGASAPDGDTRFVFRAGDLDFQSNAYEWLVVAGTSRAQLKGTGTINGFPDFGFLLSVEDADADGVPSAKDRFRIKIWNRNYPGEDKVVYDNQVAQEIGGGSIVIHTGNKK